MCCLLRSVMLPVILEDLSTILEGPDCLVIVLISIHLTSFFEFLEMKVKGWNDHRIGMRRTRKERYVRMYKPRDNDVDREFIKWRCDDPNLHCFERDGNTRTTVAEYFKDAHKITLQYPKVCSYYCHLVYYRCVNSLTLK
jgi:hypothetical protein